MSHPRPPSGQHAGVDPRPLDRRSGVPLWAQLLDDLRARLAGGEFAERFPTDAELTSWYGVSRHTVREAVRHLSETGVLKRERGRGSRVHPAEFEQPLGGLYSLFRSVEARGTEQRSVVLAIDLRADATAAGHLGLGRGDRLFYLERVRCAGDAPLALDRVWLPADVGAQLLDADFGHTALYDELARRCGVVLDEARERFAPVNADARLAAALGVGRGAAVLRIERTGSCHGRLVEFRETMIRGDRFAFVVEWSGRGGGTSALAAEHVT